MNWPLQSMFKCKMLNKYFRLFLLS